MMPGTDSLHPYPPEFEPFLYASVGEDRNGCVVTVLSALARLGFDPWSETADLVMLGREAGRARLGQLLAGFRDVPALGSDHKKVARKLSLLLPESPPMRDQRRAGARIATGRSVRAGAIWAMVAIVLILLQILIVIKSG